MEALFRAILMWSLLVARKELALEDDPSVPLRAAFAAGYSLKWGSHGLEIWGEVPWTIDPSELMRRAGECGSDGRGREPMLLERG